MPELPEVETVRRSLIKHACQQTILQVIIRQFKLRWPIPKNLPKLLAGQAIAAIDRRGKYLLFKLNKGTLILHLGMSGRFYVCPGSQPVNKHDHVDFVLTNGYCLRFTDPRRFGSIHFTIEDPLAHPLLKNLGPEPLTSAFTGKKLFSLVQKRSTPIKSFIMDSQMVVGVGNIYATEALFLAGIHPQRAAGSLNLIECERLAKAIKKVLQAAIKEGGTTLKDFVSGDSAPGYFKQYLYAYSRAGLNCLTCETVLTEIRQNQRSTVFCSKCQI